jgi:fatty acid desaturase
MMADKTLTEEQALRKEIEKRIKARNEAQVNLFTHILFFLFINIWLFGFGGWINRFLDGSLTMPNIITAVWGFALVMHIIEYSHDHGYGYERRQRRIDKEYDRLMRLHSGQKRKIDDLLNDPSDDQEIYLNEDGEISFKKKS